MGVGLGQARRQVFRNRILGWLLRGIAFIGLIEWLLRNELEFFTHGVNSPLFGRVSYFLAKLISWFYQTVPGVAAFWNLPPLFYPYLLLDPINLPTVIYFGFCVGVGLLGTGFIQAARSLSRNIKHFEEYDQRQQWNEERRPQTPRTVNAGTYVQAEINLSSEDKWWTRPWELLA